MAACPKCGQENPDRFRVCGMCGEPLPADDGRAREVRKTVTIVFCDVVDSTSLADGTDPEVVRDVMSGFFVRVREVVERHGGTLEKFIGDAAMAVFGVPTVHEDDALRAVRAAVEVRDALVELQIPARIGVNTGEVVAHPGDNLVTGDAVNVAARLEQRAPAGDVLIGDATLQLVKDAVTAEPTPPLIVKGKSAPVSAWRLASVTDAASGFVRRLDMPIVGRAHELQLLRDALARADRERRCHLFTLLGAPGVGKSRLASELVATAGTTARAYVGQCLSYGEGITYWPVAEILRAAAGTGDAEDRAAARDRLAQLVPGDPEAAVLVDRLASAMGLGGAPAPAEEINWAIRRAFEHLGRERPAILVFEDINWGEPALLDLIDYLAGACRGSRLLLLCTARPELLDERPGWAGGKTDATTILVEPLQDEECDALISALAAGRSISAEQRARVIDAAEGNPLFVEQILAMTARASTDVVDVPPTISALLQARLDRLAPAERQVVECASIEGRVFHRSAVTDLVGRDLGRDVAALLDRLIRRELIEAVGPEFLGGEAFRFQHLLIRDAAYGSIPKRVRAGHHERFAAWLESTAGDHLEQYEEIFAYHLAEAVRYRRELGGPDAGAQPLADRAAECYRRAADRAAVRSDYLAGASMLSRLVELLPAGDARVWLALIDRAHWLRWARPEQASAAAQAAVAAASSAGGETDRLVGIFARFVRMNIDEEVDVTELFEEALAEARRLDATDQSAAARLWWIVANIAETYLHRSSVAVTAAARSRELAAATGAEWLWADATGMLIQSTTHGPGEISELLARGERLVEGAGGLRRAMYLDIRAYLLAQRGDLADALGSIDEAAAIWSEYGISTWLKYGPAWLRGSVLLIAGRPHDAIPPLRSALELARRSGGDTYTSTIQGLLSRALALTGDHTAALAEAESARALTRPGDVLSQMLWRGAEIRALGSTGDVARSKELAGELAAILSGVEVPELRFDALMDLADAERLSGNPAAARELLLQALSESETRGARSFSDRASAALADLGG
jgi:class 3 adenylate cyclase/tetratricopeptide (TPR) repeat protein